MVFFNKSFLGDDESDPPELEICDVDLECRAHYSIISYVLGGSYGE